MGELQGSEVKTREFRYIRELVHRHSAIVLDDGKEWLVESRLSPVAAREGFRSVEDLVRALEERPFSPLHSQVVAAIATNETTFFRDFHPFEALRKVVLPDLLRRRAAERRLEIWSAACSSGQEPYSLVMLLEEHFPSLSGWDVRVLATDISSEMIERARRGRYSQVEVNRGLPAPYLLKYLEKQGHEWELSDALRRKVDFREINLAGEWPGLPPMDIILLRNVLIYFDVETKKAILEKTRRLLRPDGYLFLGAAETTLNLAPSFEGVTIGKVICYRAPSDDLPG